LILMLSQEEIDQRSLTAQKLSVESSCKNLSKKSVNDKYIIYHVSDIVLRLFRTILLATRSIPLAVDRRIKKISCLLVYSKDSLTRSIQDDEYKALDHWLLLTL
jgi:hypothetical protein